MKIHLTILSTLALACLASSSAVWGVPGDRTAIVLTMKGPAQVTSPTSLEVTSGMALTSGQSVNVEAGSECVVLLLGTARRTKIVGPATLQVRDGAVEGPGAELPLAELAVAPAGLNYRVLKRSLLRSSGPKRYPSSLIVESYRLTPAGVLEWKVRGKGDSAPLCAVDVYPSFDLPTIGGDGVVDIPTPLSTKAQVAKVASKSKQQPWQYSVQIPGLQAGKSYGFAIFSGKVKIFYGCVRRITAQQEAKLKIALAEVDKLIRSDPRDASAYVMKAELLEDFDRLPEAAVALNDALRLNPHDKGLERELARVYLEGGREQLASKTLLASQSYHR